MRAVARRVRQSSVRIRIAVLATVVVGATLAGGAWALVAAVEHRLLDQIRDSQQDQLQQVQTLVQGGKSVSPGVLSGVAGPGNFVAILDRSGNQLAASTQGVETTYTELPVDAPGTAVGGGVLFVGGLPADFEIRTASVPTPGGPVTVVAATSLEEVERSVATLSRLLWLGVPLLAAAVGAATWMLVGRALRPVDAMCAEVDEITAHTITRRVPEPSTRDEIQHLARTMNAMLGRLEDAQTRQRRFVSDASHELRSPVAVARTNLEVALAHPVGADWPAVAATVLGETGRLDRLIADLLDTAQIDEDGRPWEPVDLEEVVLAEAGRFPAIGAQGVSAGRVMGDRRLLARLVRNLFDNAARHARSEVSVSLDRDADGVILTVEDDGAGIPADDRERVFERFTRLEDGRARDGGGAGLGLAQVRHIAEQHGGRVRAEAGRAGGARFVVQLPATS